MEILKSWENSKRTLLGLSGFYFILISFVFGKYNQIFFWKHFSHPNWLWIFRLFPAFQNPNFYYSIFFFAAISCMVAAFLPFISWVRFAAGFGVLLIYSLEASFLYIPFNQMVLVLAACVFAIPKLSYINQVSIIRVYLFAAYTMSGIWKFRGLWEFTNVNQLERIAKTLPEHMAYAWGEGSLPDTHFMGFLNQHSTVSTLLWIGVIIFQISFFIPILYSHLQPLFAWLAFFFHLLTLSLLGIFFDGQCILLAWAFFLSGVDHTEVR